jgi:hypothetical protein
VNDARTLKDWLIFVTFLAFIMLTGCAAPSPLAPEDVPPTAIKDCMTAGGQWYNCESPSDTLPYTPECLDYSPPCSIIPEVPEDA